MNPLTPAEHAQLAIDRITAALAAPMSNREKLRRIASSVAEWGSR